MPEARWKRFERDVAAPGGGARIPVSGRNPGDPDVVLPWLPGFFVEVRDRARPRGPRVGDPHPGGGGAVVGHPRPFVRPPPAWGGGGGGGRDPPGEGPGGAAAGGGARAESPKGAGDDPPRRWIGRPVDPEAG